MNKMKKILLKVLLWGLIIDLVILAIVFVVNLPVFDEELDAEVVELFKMQEHILENNALVLVYGFNAPSDQDFIEQGKREMAAALDNEHSGEPPSELEAWQDVRWQPDYDHLGCLEYREQGCFKKLVHELEQQPLVDNERFELLVQRYERLLSEPSYSARGYYLWGGYHTPAFGDVAHVSRLLRARYYSQKDFAGLIAFLAREDAFWRMVLRSESTLVGSMIAVGRLWSGLFVASSVLNEPSLDNAVVEQFAASLTALTADETDLSESLKIEALFAIGLFDQRGQIVAEERSFLHNLFYALAYQPNASHNAKYRHYFKPMFDVAAISAPELDRDDLFFLIDYNELRWSPSVIYNLVGKVTLEFSIPSDLDFLLEYCRRIHDLSGIYRLLKIQVGKAQGVDIKQLLQSPELANPYTLKPMSYDQAAQTLTFNCISKNSDICQINI